MRTLTRMDWKLILIGTALMLSVGAMLILKAQ